MLRFLNKVLDAKDITLKISIILLVYNQLRNWVVKLRFIDKLRDIIDLYFLRMLTEWFNFIRDKFVLWVFSLFSAISRDSLASLWETFCVGWLRFFFLGWLLFLKSFRV